MTPDEAIRKTVQGTKGGTAASRQAIWALHKAQGKPAPRLTRKGKRGIESDLARIPAPLRDGLEESVRGITWAEAQKRARKLADEGHIRNPKRFGAWLYWVGKA